MNQQVRLAPAEKPDLRARFTSSEFLQMIDAGAFGKPLPVPGTDRTIVIE